MWPNVSMRVTWHQHHNQTLENVQSAKIPMLYPLLITWIGVNASLKFLQNNLEKQILQK